MTEKQQGRLNFTHGNKLFILREVAPFLPHPRMTRVLRAIQERHWQYARDADEVSLSHKQIAKYDGMSVPTVRRAIADLIDHQLLIKTETVSCYGRQANSYKIVWSNLDAIVNDGEPLTDPAPVPDDSEAVDSETPAPDLEYESTQVVKTASDHHDQSPDHHDHPPDHSDHPPPDHHDQASINPKLINPPPPSEINNPTWREVEEILISEFGVGRPGKAVAAAQANDCTPADILPLFAYARSKPGAYGAGAIFTKISEARPGRDPTQGWPEESEEYLKQQARKKLKVQQTKKARTEQEREERKRQDQAERQRLESEFGPVLDGMTRDQLRAYVTEHCLTPVAQAIARNPDAHCEAGFWRTEILKSLKARQTDCLDHLDSANADGPAFADQR
ncbi:hypothetical protein Enr10x_21430 [Gimesia panareensis]|uniref:MarR family protein n=1 Tax=Gimesia panareensis TaxID=2527978 RepID=A0A517Q5C0_9PLAN|nr:hypothetical protein [Gimesia panareensis]QDT26833.1 hypothetical protein Enr10x_21430 [Gimesia panareensis]